MMFPFQSYPFNFHDRYEGYVSILAGRTPIHLLWLLSYMAIISIIKARLSYSTFQTRGPGTGLVHNAKQRIFVTHHSVSVRLQSKMSEVSDIISGRVVEYLIYSSSLLFQGTDIVAQDFLSYIHQNLIGHVIQSFIFSRNHSFKCWLSQCFL